MEDSLLLKISLVCTAVGLIALLTMQYTTTITEIHIQDIGEDSLGEKVVLKGRLVSVRKSADNKTSFLKISQECTIDAVVFDDIIIPSTSGSENSIIVEGVVDEYDGRKEILVRKLSMDKK